MDAATIYQRFVERAPAAVLVHGLIESCLSPAFLDAAAAPHLPASPNPRQLAFSHLVEILLCGANDVVVADSCFCTEAFLMGTRRRGAGVIVRHHGGVGLTPLGERRDCGRVETGVVTY